MIKICDLDKFYSNNGLNYIVAKIKTTKYNHVHQSCFVDISYCDINIIICCAQYSMTYYVMGVGGGVHGVQNPLPPQANIFFL